MDFAGLVNDASAEYRRIQDKIIHHAVRLQHGRELVAIRFQSFIAFYEPGSSRDAHPIAMVTGVLDQFEGKPHALLKCEVEVLEALGYKEEDAEYNDSRGYCNFEVKLYG